MRREADRVAPQGSKTDGAPASAAAASGAHDAPEDDRLSVSTVPSVFSDEGEEGT